MSDVTITEQNIYTLEPDAVDVDLLGELIRELRIAGFDTTAISVARERANVETYDEYTPCFTRGEMAQIAIGLDDADQLRKLSNQPERVDVVHDISRAIGRSVQTALEDVVDEGIVSMPADHDPDLEADLDHTVGA